MTRFLFRRRDRPGRRSARGSSPERSSSRRLHLKAHLREIADYGFDVPVQERPTWAPASG